MFRIKKLAYAQLLIMGAVAPAAAMAEEEVREEVVVVGSQIKGAQVAGALPVTLVGQDDIENVAATTGDELFRSIPQVGEVAFSSERAVGGVNDARGDVGSVNLRGVGTGNTLTLLNGRRLVLHPGTQTESFVPVVTVNTNAVPVSGIERLEVLRDGASAIYGTDAVAGVVNTVLKKDFEGVDIKLNYGTSEGTSLEDTTVTILGGTTFNDGATNLSGSFSYFHRKGMPTSDRDYAASSDRRSFFDGTSFEGDSDLDNRTTSTPFIQFAAEIDVGTLTSSRNRAHVQPITNDGCRSGTEGQLGPGLCLDNAGFSSSSTLPDADDDFTTTDRMQRFDSNALRSLTSDVERANLFVFLNHEFENGMSFFGEASYYEATANREREQSGLVSSQPLTISREAYYNPFGAVSTGGARLIGFDSIIPDEGVALTIGGPNGRYRAIDAGNRQIEVDNDSFRILGGLSGTAGDWDWETAALYTESNVEDVASNRISLTLFQQAINRTTDDAYNPFNGAGAPDPSTISRFNPFGTFTEDGTPGASQDVIDSFLIDVTRESQTTLTLVDFKLSNAALFSLPAGDVGMAFGVEWREEEFEDDRDDRLDGTTQFVDAVNGNVVASDVAGSSATPDSSGDRNVFSSYVEFAVPLLRDLPLVQSLDAQVAARYESFSDVGDVLVPKVALSWYPVSWLQVRAAYSEGFRAPNLPQLDPITISRVNTDTDTVRDERMGIEEFRSGSADLDPEDDENTSFGIVLTPNVGEGDLTITADYWKIEQDGVVGLFTAQNQLQYDFLLRSMGSFNPAVVRTAPDADDIAAGLPGQVIRVDNQYENLGPRLIEGLDVAVIYKWDTDIGNFTAKINGAHLINFEQEADSRGAALLAAEASGGLGPDAVAVEGIGDLMEDRGRPEWKATGSLNWRHGPWRAGVFAKWTAEVNDNARNSDGTLLRADEFVTVNISGSYEFEGGVLDRTRIRAGVRNVFDEEPPLVDEGFGYLSQLHSNRGRFFHVSVSKKFR